MTFGFMTIYDSYEFGIEAGLRLICTDGVIRGQTWIQEKLTIYDDMNEKSGRIYEAFTFFI